MDYREYLNKLMDEVRSVADSVKGAGSSKADQAKIVLNQKKAEQELDKAYLSLGKIMYQIEKGSLKRDDLIVGAAVRQVEYQEGVLEALKLQYEEAGKRASEEVDNLKKVGSSFAEKADEAGDEVANAVREAAESVEDAFKKVAEDVTSAVEDTASEAEAAVEELEDSHDDADSEN